MSYSEDKFAPAEISVSALPTGGWSLVSPGTVPDNLDTIVERLRFWASKDPERPLISQKEGGVWKTASYGEVDRTSEDVARRLLSRGLDAENPLMLISDASIEQFLFRMGAIKARIPFIPVSPALVRHRSSERFHAIVKQFAPGLIAISKDIAGAARGAIEAVGVDCHVIDGLEHDPIFWSYRPGSDTPLPNISMDDVAAYFLTSGSTGVPKAVPITHRMISVTQESYVIAWPFLLDHPPVLLDWLPWHHTFGGNDNINKIIWTGGSYYIDDGLPTAQFFKKTVENIRAVRPTIHINVPKGIKELIAYLGEDAEFFRTFYERLDVIFFAAAGLDDESWLRLKAANDRAHDELGSRTTLVTGYGATETGSIITLVHFPIDRPSVIGLPVPGMEVRLVPDGEKFEVRAKGAAIMPGYFKNPEANKNAFDGEGFYRTGDAALFFDHSDPAKGLQFDGRLSEDFKLATGTWVSVGPLRAELLTVLSPFVRDVLIAGRDQENVAIVVFLDESTCQREFDLPADMPLSTSAAVRDAIRRRLIDHNKRFPASSKSVFRAVVDDLHPDSKKGEVTDKGSVNQRNALANREHLLELLYAKDVERDVIQVL